MRSRILVRRLSSKKIPRNGFTPETPCSHAKIMLMYAGTLKENYEGRDMPSHEGILRPDLRLRLMSIRPHLSSHSSLPGVLYRIFHGSSNAENLYID